MAGRQSHCQRALSTDILITSTPSVPAAAEQPASTELYFPDQNLPRTDTRAFHQSCPRGRACESATTVGVPTAHLLQSRSSPPHQQVTDL